LTLVKRRPTAALAAMGAGQADFILKTKPGSGLGVDLCLGQNPETSNI